MSLATMMGIEDGRAPGNIGHHRYGVTIALAQHLKRLRVSATTFYAKFLILEVKPKPDDVANAMLDSCFNGGHLRLNIAAAPLELDKRLFAHPASKSSISRADIKASLVSIVT